MNRKNSSAVLKAKPEGTFSGGFVRDRGEGRGVRVAKAKSTEIPLIADPIAAQERSLALAVAGPYDAVVKPLRARQTRLARLGIPTDLLDLADPEYARCIKWANSYKKTRVKELYTAHGWVSAGVHALCASESLALAASRYLYATVTNGEFMSDNRLKMASSLADSARQNNLSAWELCAREAQIKRRNDANTTQLPWVVQESLGMIKRPRGRPRKASIVEMETDHAGPRAKDKEEYIGETEGSS